MFWHNRTRRALKGKAGWLDGWRVPPAKRRPLDHEESAVTLQRARDGSSEALNRIFHECGERLLALIRLRLGPELRRHIESRDILQDTLLRAFENFDDFRGSSNKTLMAWLAAIAGNQIRNQVEYFHRQRRDVKQTVPLDENLHVAATEVRSQVTRLNMNEEAMNVESALDSMDELHREVILMRNFEELTFAEIGERIGKGADASRMLYARSMVSLTNKVRELSGEHP